ncbi:S-layer homology domain-containing protein, partial [Cohnella suwonensis]
AGNASSVAAIPFTTTATPDTTAPTLSLTSASATTDTTTTLNFTSDEAGTYYYVVYAAADAAPNAATIAAQGTAVAKGTAAAVAAANTANVTGLTASTAYKAYVIVKDAAGNASGIATISFTTIVTPDTTAPTLSSTDTQNTPNTGVEVLVNGKAENAGTATTTKVNEQTVTTVAVDSKKLEDKLAAEGEHAVITIPVNTKSDVVIGELDGQMVKDMEQKQAVVEIKTADATYTLPAQQINISAISDQLGKSVQLQDIKLQIEISKPNMDTVKVVENSAAKGEFALVVPPLNFTVKAKNGDTTIEVSKFNVYVERTIAIPDGIDPSKITTGVVVDPDGTVRHVPTKIVIIDGKYYAKVNSLTNSTYSVVWHPIEFKDVAQHWAKDAVNDMGSRMVISGIGNDMFNPDQDITRAEFAAIMVRGLGLKLENGSSPFADVKITDWYSSAIQTAYAYKLISGFEDGNFRPMDKITREQAMTIIAKAMEITGLGASLQAKAADELLSPFADANNASEWAKNGIADCLQVGIVSGRSGTVLAPKAYITRAEVAAIVQRLLQKSELI